MRFSLIIPCHNESSSLHRLADQCKIILDSHSDIEFILVDNGSADNTSFLLKQIPIKSIRLEIDRGYDRAILEGLKCASGDILGWFHANTQVHPRDVIHGKKLFEKYGKNIFAKGRRHGRSLSDNFFTAGMSLFESALLGVPLWDINAQPSLFSRTFFQSWTNPPEGSSLDLYAYYQAKKQGLAIHRFPISYSRKPHHSSHQNTNWQAKMKSTRKTVHSSLKLKRKLFK